MKMRHSSLALPLTLSLAFAVTAGAEPPPLGIPVPAGTPQRPRGLPALEPSAQGVVLNVDKVKKFIASHNLPHNLGSADDIQVTSVETLDVDKVKQRVGIDTTGFKGNERVGLAMLGGRVVFGGPPPDEPMVYTRAYVVFDALTGNLLMLGTLED
jgi:hypothetical protein